MTTARGPSARISRAAFRTLCVPQNCRASASFTVTMSTRVMTAAAHEPDRRVEACGQRKIRSGAAEDVAAAVVGGVHVVVGQRADDEDVRRHGEADVSWWGRAGPRARARC